MKNTAYDLLDLVSLQQWQQSTSEDNHQRMERLKRNLSIAVTEELTPRQQQLLHMFYYEGKNVTDIARELAVNKSTVSRTLHRARLRLRKSLRYAL